MALSRERVLAHLDRWAEHRSAVVAAVAAGMRDRVLSGEFDEREEEEP